MLIFYCCLIPLVFALDLIEFEDTYFFLFLSIIITIASCIDAYRRLNGRTSPFLPFLLFYISGFTIWYFLPFIDNFVVLRKGCEYYRGHCLNESDILSGFRSTLIYYASGYFLLVILNRGHFEARRTKPTNKDTTVTVFQNQPGLITYFLALILLIYVALTYIYFGNPLNNIRSVFAGDMLGREWNDYINTGNSISGSTYSLVQFFAIVSVSTTLAVVKPKGVIRSALILLAITCALLIMARTFNRSYLLIMIGPSLIRTVATSHFGIKRIAIGLVGVVLATAAMTTILSYRTSDETQEAIYSRFSTLPLGRTNDMAWETSLAIRAEAEIGPQWDNPAWEHITYIVPRAIYEEKPFPYSIREYSLYRDSIDILLTGGNVFPGIVGYFRLNHGVLGVVSFLLLILVFQMFYSFSQRKFSRTMMNDSLPLIIGTCFILNVRNLQTGLNVSIILFMISIYFLYQIKRSQKPSYLSKHSIVPDWRNS